VRCDYTAGLWFFNEVLLGALEAEREQYSYVCGFGPSVDGFGSSLQNLRNPGIWLPSILGQNAFAVWYYRNYRSEGRLNKRFDKFTQSMISERASFSTWLGGSDKLPNPGNSPDDMQKNFALVKSAIRHSNGPVVVLYQEETVLPMYNQHMVAYGYHSGKLYMYSPARPGETIVGTPLEEDHRLFLLGIDKFSMHESFENILLDATADPPFGGSANATVNVASHQPGDLVESTSTTLSGFVQSGERLVSELYIWNTRFPVEQMVQTSIPETGDFAVSIKLEPGENQLMFITQALSDSFQWRPDPYLVQVRNSLEPDGFTLRQGEAPVPAGQLRVDIDWVAYYGDGVPVGEAWAEKPFLGINKTDIGMFYVDYLNPGSLSAEPFALWEDQTQYTGGFATAGRYRITCAQVDPGTYTVMMTAPILSHEIIKVTNVKLSGVVNGSYAMNYGWAPANYSWVGVTYDSAANTVQVADQSYENWY
jgi:hypothetical protein